MANEMILAVYVQSVMAKTGEKCVSIYNQMKQ